MIRVRSCIAMGAAVREQRDQQGLTQANLARRAGVSRQWLSALENGKPSVEMGKVLVVLSVLELSVGLEQRPARNPRRPSATDVLLAATMTE